MRLPLLFGGLLVVVVAVFTWTAYAVVRRASTAAAEGRLQTVTDELALALGRSRSQLLTYSHALADSGPVRGYVEHPTPAGRAAALDAIVARGLTAAQIGAVELWRAGPQPVLATGDTARWASLAEELLLLRQVTPGDTAVLGRFHLAGDSVGYPVAAPIVRDGAIRGYVLLWMRVVSSPDARVRLTRLVGADARVYVGTHDGAVWTDMSEAAEAPPVDLSQAPGLVRYSRPGVGAVTAAQRGIRGSSWVVLVEFPRAQTALAATAFLRRMLLLGTGIILLGLAAAWWLSRSITRPLARLTSAATAYAEGAPAPATALEGRGDELGALGAAFETMMTHVRDARWQLEERVRARTAELQERNEELEAFGYSISHDLRAPLRAMEGFSQALLEDFGDRLDATGRGYAERVVAAARRMDLLIRDLLAFSRVSRADMPLSPVELDGLIAGVVEQLGPEVAARNATIAVQRPLPVVRGNAPVIAQVITNLVGNAIKFVPPDRAPMIHVWTELRDGAVRLWVEDNGIGIAREHLSRLFRVFERLNRGDDYPGTGIGLAIVRKAVDRMGGRAGVDSTPGAGSRFWVELPRREMKDEREAGRHSAG